MQQIYSATALMLSCAPLASVCSSTLVRGDVKRTAGLDDHCAGSEWVDDLSLAVLPVPAFFMPHFDLQKIAGGTYFHRCGSSMRVANCDVSVNTTSCTPAGLTRIVTLGVWQWCPARVAWAADVPADGCFCNVGAAEFEGQVGRIAMQLNEGG